MTNKWSYLILVALLTTTVFSSFVVAGTTLYQTSLMCSNDDIGIVNAGKYCLTPSALSAHWCSTGMAVSSCNEGCTMYNNANGCGTGNWGANCKAGCTGSAGCNTAY
ncbi:MAG: hypothetical protein AABY10_03840 [Nanoarchaeota archaeon]